MLRRAQAQIRPSFSARRWFSQAASVAPSTGDVSSTATSTAIPLKKLLQTQLKEAMRSKNAVRQTTIKSILADLLLIDKQPGQSTPVTSPPVVKFPFGTDPSVQVEASDRYLTAIRKSIRKHEDSIRQFQAAERSDLVEKEQQELLILQEFLPAVKAVDPEELRRHCEALVAQVQATGMKDLKKVLAKTKEPSSPIHDVPAERIVACLKEILLPK